ncbi:hypothetical protein KAU33_09240 [Candidatus Dependentiae bacterium]|nr:hypothetical protein [Candidatus Dependentiae bacterium]
MRTFRSMNEIKKYYFPDAYKKEQWEKMSPKEKGIQMAKEVIEGFKRGEK